MRMLCPAVQAVMRFGGGEAAGLARLRHYLWDTDAVATYLDTRNGVFGLGDSCELPSVCKSQVDALDRLPAAGMCRTLQRCLRNVF